MEEDTGVYAVVTDFLAQELAADVLASFDVSCGSLGQILLSPYFYCPIVQGTFDATALRNAYDLAFSYFEAADGDINVVDDHVLQLATVYIQSGVSLTIWSSRLPSCSYSFSLRFFAPSTPLPRPLSSLPSHCQPINEAYLAANVVIETAHVEYELAYEMLQAVIDGILTKRRVQAYYDQLDVATVKFALRPLPRLWGID